MSIPLPAMVKPFIIAQTKMQPRKIRYWFRRGPRDDQCFAYQIMRQPIMAKREEEAPTLMGIGSITALKRLPPIPPKSIKERYLYHLPSAFSTVKPIDSRERRFQKMWKNPE